MKKRCKFILCFMVCLSMLMGMLPTTDYADNSAVVISSAQLLENNGSVYGNGILTGTTDNGTEEMDDKCWNRADDTNRGYDNSNANDIVRSFDVITYNINTGVNNLGGKAHKIGFIVEIPNDQALDVTSINGELISEKEENDKKYIIFNGM